MSFNMPTRHFIILC